MQYYNFNFQLAVHVYVRTYVHNMCMYTCPVCMYVRTTYVRYVAGHYYYYYYDTYTLRARCAQHSLFMMIDASQQMHGMMDDTTYIICILACRARYGYDTRTYTHHTYIRTVIPIYNAILMRCFISKSLSVIIKFMFASNLFYLHEAKKILHF